MASLQTERRRRDIEERRHKAIQNRRARECHIEHIKEISRRNARLSASGRCLARQRVKSVALMTKLSAAIESEEKRGRQVLSRPLSSGARKEITCKHSRRVVAEPPSTASILDLLQYDAGGKEEVGTKAIDQWDPDGVKQGQKRRLRPKTSQ